MKVYNNYIYKISLDSMRNQWVGGKPYIPDSVIERPEYSTNLLRELGCDVAYVVVDNVETMNPELIKSLMERGVNVAGKTMRLAFITQRKSVKAPLPIVDEDTAAWVETMFPRVIDVVRGGAMLTPMRGGVAVKVMAKVLLTTPDDPRFQLGDGQGIIAADWMPGHLTQRWKVQFRAVLHGVNNGYDMLGKGTLMVKNEAAMHGYDFVLTKNEVKGGDGSLPLGEHEIPVTLGVIHGPNDSLSGATTFGRQFMQHMDASFFEHPETVKHVKRVAKTLHKLVDNPVRLAKFLSIYDGNDSKVGVMRDMRSESGDVNRGALLGFAATLCDALGNNKLMHTELINQLLMEALAIKSRNLAVSGGMAARYYVLTADNTLPVGVIKINDQVLKNKHFNETEVVAGRNPHVEFKGTVAVTLVGDRNVHPDYAVAHELTMIDAAADVDGDQIIIGIGDAPQMKIWRDALLKVDRSNTSKVRRKGTPPATKHEMIAQVLNINIGYIERCLANFLAIEKMHGKKVSGYIGKVRTSLNVDDVKDVLAGELQKAVDGIKTGSMPNMKIVNDLMAFSSQLVSKRDVGYIPLDNGSLPIFRNAPRKLTRKMIDLGVDPEEYVIPENYVSDKTPLGKHMLKVSPMVPCVSYDVIPNAEFYGWLDLIPGDGAQEAVQSTRRLNAAIAKAHNLPEEEQEAAVSEAISAFRVEWREHYEAKKISDQQWLRSAASQFWTLWAASGNKGYALWHSIPEVWGTMLMDRKDEIKAVKSIKRGRIIGSDFATVMGDNVEAWFDVTVYKAGSKKRVKVRHNDGIADNLLDEHCNAEPGKYRALVRSEGKKSSFPALFHEAKYELPVVRKPDEEAVAKVVNAVMEEFFSAPVNELGAESYFDADEYDSSESFE